MTNVTGGQLVAEALIEREIKYVFSLSGGHITPVYQFLENSPVKIFDTRHEQAAVFMAEAFSRMTLKPCVALVTAGPGFTNSLSAVANARLANSPLLLISGSVSIDSAEKLDLQDMRQLPVIEPMVKKTFVCHKPERIVEFVDMAYRTALSGRPGPVYLELPVDILNAQIDSKNIKYLKTTIDSKPVEVEKAKQMIEMINSSSKPVIIAGSGAWYSDSSSELIEFVEKTEIPVYTIALGRGIIPDTHPLCFESALGIRPGSSLFATLGADLIILLGTRINLYYVFGEMFNKSAKIIQVDIEPEEIGRNRSIDLAIVSDIGEILKECNKLIIKENMSNEIKNKFKQWVSAIREAHKIGKDNAKLQWEGKSSPIHPIHLAWQINEFMNKEDDIVIADGGDTQVWMAMTRTVRRAGHYLDSGLFGCLGVGLPYANAAKLLYPEKRVCLIVGDGSVGFNFMEFETSIRKNLPIVVVINNDLGWGMIRHSQQLRIGHSIVEGTEIGIVNYHKLVEALGGKGLYVEKSEDIRPALEEAFSSGKTTCINVITDPKPISPGSVALANLGGFKAK